MLILFLYLLHTQLSHARYIIYIPFRIIGLLFQDSDNNPTNHTFQVILQFLYQIRNVIDHRFGNMSHLPNNQEVYTSQCKKQVIFTMYSTECVDGTGTEGHKRVRKYTKINDRMYLVTQTSVDVHFVPFFLLSLLIQLIQPAIFSLISEPSNYYLFPLI